MNCPIRPVRTRNKQTGLALLLIIGILGLGATLMLVRALNEAALGENHRLGNARILEDAKAALVMAVGAEVATEAHPGKLPCPEDISKIGTSYEGDPQTSCSLPAVGRLPWRFLGYPAAPLDLDGEPLWYAVSPGFSLVTPTANLVLNSDTPAGLTVDGSPARAVALIFSPGRQLPGQSRPAVTSSSVLLTANYLEGENATPDTSFATYGPAKSASTTFNDQAVIVSHRDLFAVIEMEVARRIEQTFITGATPLKDVYASWGTSSGVPLLPYAAPFGNPTTSTFQGVNTITNQTSQGFLPLTFSTKSGSLLDCNTATDGVRCDPAFVRWSSFQSLSKAGGGLSISVSPAPSCTYTDSQLSCTMYNIGIGTLTVRVVATASNVAMALRQLNSDAPSISDFQTTGRTLSAAFNSDGSATITFTGTLSGNGTLGAFFCPGALFGIFCYKRTFSLPIRIFSDHPFVNSANTDVAWFYDNEWYKLTYYAVAAEFTASGTQSCSAPNCLTVTNSSAPTDNKRALLIFAGRAIRTQSRPSGTLADYLESENLTPVDSTFVTLKPSLESNDRTIVVDSN